MTFCQRLLLISATVLACFPDAQGADHQSLTTAIRVENDSAIVSIHINQQEKPLRFLLDTGAEITIIDARTAQDLGLPEGKDIDVVTVGEQSTVPTVRINTLRFGPVHVGPIDVAKYDLTGLTRGVGSRVDGVIGIDVLSRKPFTIDYGKKQLSFGEPSRLRNTASAVRVPIRKGQGGYVVSAIANGTNRIELLLDTGTNFTQLPSQIWQQLTKEWQPQRVLCGAKSTGRDDSNSCFARLESMSFESLKIDHPVVKFLGQQQAGVFADPDPPGLLGTDFLKRFVVTIDFSNEEIILVPSSTYKVDPYEYSTVGFQYVKQGTTYFVASVLEESPAAQSGVQVGDEIVAIRGQPVGRLSKNDLHALLHGPPGTLVKLTLRRAGKSISYDLLLRQLL